MKPLVVFYSRTGATGTLARAIAKELGCDVLELQDTVKRKGIFGYIRSGRQAAKKKLTTLKPLDRRLEDYDLFVLGTPIWMYRVSVPMRTFVVQNRERLGRIAFFTTRGGSPPEKTEPDIEELLRGRPLAVLHATKREVEGGALDARIREFANKVKSQ